MSTNFKDPLKSNTMNEAFIGKSDDDTKSGKLKMDKVSEGSTIESVQKSINENFDVAGTSEGDVNAKVYPTNNKISDGDNQKECIENFDVAIQTNEDSIQTINASVGQPNGICPTDGSNKVPPEFLPTNMMEFEGDWDASTNLPILDNTDVDKKGTVYKVTVAGTVDFGAGPIIFKVNDWCYNTGTIWNQSDEQSIPDTDSLPEGSSNFYTNQDTKANLDALPRKQGKFYYATDESKGYIDDGIALIAIGSGEGGGVEVKHDFVIPAAAATTVTFLNETYIYANGANQFFRNGVLLVREIASGAVWSIDPLIAPTEYKEVDNGLYSTDILINPLSPASGLTEFTMWAQKNIDGGLGEDVLPLMAKGSLVSSDGSNNGELAVGADGETLVADSAESGGLKWKAPGGGVEAGTILSFGGTIAPTGYLLCDGSAMDRTVYASLYSSIADAYGNGDGATTFLIPDLRGNFLRGTDSGAGQDPDAGTRIASGTGGAIGDNVGSYQADGFKEHTHSYTLETGAGSITPSVSGKFSNSSAASSLVGDSETRPKNINVNYIIKY